MATDTYWEKTRARLYEKYRFPLDPSKVRARGWMPTVIISEVLQCLVVGMSENAQAVLKLISPQMEEELASEEANREKGPSGDIQLIASISRSAHLAHWLHHDRIDLSLAERALRWRHALNAHYNSSKLTQPNLLDSMLLEVETEKPERAIPVYEANEKSPLVLPPKNMRFSSNARSVLYLHLKTGKDKTSADLRKKSLASFLRNATQWDRDVSPLPYVMLMEVARISRACWWISGEDYSLSRIVEAIH